MSYMMFFFFSSRRRHTRFDCDWSSDVCSSDLVSGGLAKVSPIRLRDNFWERMFSSSEPALPNNSPIQSIGITYSPREVTLRSEERRVGKECRSRWSPYH